MTRAKSCSRRDSRKRKSDIEPKASILQQTQLLLHKIPSIPLFPLVRSKTSRAHRTRASSVHFSSTETTTTGTDGSSRSGASTPSCQSSPCCDLLRRASSILTSSASSSLSRHPSRQVSARRASSRARSRSLHNFDLSEDAKRPRRSGNIASASLTAWAAEPGPKSTPRKSDEYDAAGAGSWDRWDSREGGDGCKNMFNQLLLIENLDGAELEEGRIPRQVESEPLVTR